MNSVQAVLDSIDVTMAALPLAMPLAVRMSNAGAIAPEFIDAARHATMFDFHDSPAVRRRAKRNRIANKRARAARRYNRG